VEERKRKMNRKVLRISALLVLLALVLTACGAAEPEVIEKEVTVRETVLVESEPEVVEKEVTTVVETVVTATPEPGATGGGTFVGSVYITITSVDPHRAVEFSDGTVLPLVYEGLVAMGPDGEWKGVLAESWDVSDDGLTWTFHMREGVKFHNGREMTADDVVFSFERIMNEETGASMHDKFKGKIESTQALDPYTVEMKLTSGAGTLLSELGLGSRAAIIANECVTNDNTIVHPIGTGPFEFMWWKPGEEFRVARFDDYWGEVAKIDEAVFIYIPDNTVRFTALQTGEIDWMRALPYDQVLEFQADPPEDMELRLLFEARTVRLNMNSTRPPFDDLRVRQAVAEVIDKDDYAEAIWFGVGKPHNQPFVQGSFMELPVEDTFRSGNLEAAKALMEEAGYPDGFEVNIISHAPYKDDWEYLQTVLGQLGLQLNVEILDSAQWTRRALELDYDMVLASQSGIYHWDRTYGYFEATSSANWLVGGYDHEDVPELLLAGRSEADQNKAKEIYTEILEIIQADVACVFLGGEPDRQVWRTWVKGFDPNASNTNLVWPGGGLNYVTLDEKP
jgi:peptide/nickel transport system substrate-binding protein